MCGPPFISGRPRGAPAVVLAMPRPFSLGRRSYFFLRCHFLTCAGLLWNFFAVAVLHAPIESPCRWCAVQALRLIRIVTCFTAPFFPRA
jgi:hypothetical protein